MIEGGNQFPTASLPQPHCIIPSRAHLLIRPIPPTRSGHLLPIGTKGHCFDAIIMTEGGNQFPVAGFPHPRRTIPTCRGHLLPIGTKGHCFDPITMAEGGDQFPIAGFP